jgi:hypothetical protein
MQNERPKNIRRELSLSKIMSYTGFAMGAIILVCVLTLLFFPHPFLNNIIKPRITKAIAKAYPQYSLTIGSMNYSVFQNRLEIDSVTLSKSNGTIVSHIGTFSASGIGWMHLIWRGKPAPTDFTSSVLEVKDIALNLSQSHYDLYCDRLHLSVPDSDIIAEIVNLHPSEDDEQYFARSNSRNARFRLNIPLARVIGVAFLELLQGKSYRARSAQINDLFLDILINKDKPFPIDDTNHPMPGKILASIKGNLGIDSLNILNGQLKYGERFDIGAKPALITVDSVKVLAEGIANHGDPGAAVVVHAQGQFIEAGTMKVLMKIPVGSREFSYQYSGSLSGMNISALNSFLETAEQIRVKAGTLQSASFEINVVSGHASGNVRGIYKDLAIAAINKETGSEKGISNRTTSFIARTFKIRGSNLPDKSGSMKIGVVNYTYLPDEYFFEYSWFALRSGLKDLVGF